MYRRLRSAELSSVHASASPPSHSSHKQSITAATSFVQRLIADGGRARNPSNEVSTRLSGKFVSLSNPTSKSRSKRTHGRASTSSSCKHELPIERSTSHKMDQKHRHRFPSLESLNTAVNSLRASFITASSRCSVNELAQVSLEGAPVVITSANPPVKRSDSVGVLLRASKARSGSVSLAPLERSSWQSVGREGAVEAQHRIVVLPWRRIKRARITVSITPGQRCLTVGADGRKVELDCACDLDVVTSGVKHTAAGGA